LHRWIGGQELLTMSLLDFILEFDEALDWALDDDPLLGPEPAPAPWPLDTTLPLDGVFEA
jgi:hypothetical protein